MMNNNINSLDLASITGLTQDSRAVRPGFLFAALPGSKADGRRYINDAIRNGASVILAPRGTGIEAAHLSGDVKLITDENPRRALALLAARFYGQQPQTIVAVTGTNGKTSTVHFVKQFWLAAGYKAASIGTLGVRAPGLIRSGSMTTPDPVSLHAELADLCAVGITHLAMEASSHGLDQYRLDGVQIRAAAFTNLSRDHLDYHPDMQAYFAAKTRLFTDILQEGGAAVLNADVPECKHLIDAIGGRAHVLTYGAAGRDFKLLQATPTPQGLDLQLEIQGQAHNLALPLAGAFQAMNVLCALGLAIACAPAHAQTFIDALRALQGVPGRMQHVGGPKGAAVYIDYAHTPDALETVLKALRPHTQRRLVALFGCGGDRDRGKRPLMGKIAHDLADTVIVTDDNPRSERPDSIRAAILAGAQGAREIPGRREAIAQAIQDLAAGDVLVIAGKGHEQGQIFENHTEPFDDAQEARKVIGELT
ncbi:MAG: UDP-N-acetylmuramoyl-L-alanyl-D-glutamate--2,6-diaminopimelate ligase [Alphaproteobacteria bacterium]|nr:UDP-N-acetylmuramoyl-L-alanyl-D-glutamate--2,6-diaminopimelate ligase [Alphaproteobacteria bacterium]